MLGINYIENLSRTDDVLIGLIGTNSGIIKDVTVTGDGEVNVGEFDNTYIIGSLVAKNDSDGDIQLTDSKLVAVEASIKVEGNTAYMRVMMIPKKVWNRESKKEEVKGEEANQL